MTENVGDLSRDDEKRKAQEKLETLLMEGIQSGEPTEMTRKDWTDIRRRIEAVRGAQIPEKDLMARVP